MAQIDQQIAPQTSASSARQLQADFFSQIGAVTQFQQLFENLPDVYFFAKDAHSRLMAASRPILQRFQLESEEQLIGTTDHDHFPTHIADNFVRDDQHVLRTGQPLINRVEIWYTEHRLLDWYVTDKLPLRSLTGEIVGVMGTVRSYEGGRRHVLPYTQISEAVEYIRKRHRGKITVAEVAALAGVSPRQLHRRFQEVFGMSALDFLTKTRMQAASEELLKTDRPIVDIAIDFGFCDQSAFTRQFKNHVGQTPLKFRRQYSDRDRVAAAGDGVP